MNHPQEASLRVATCNIHKGLSIFNQRVVIHALRDQLRSLNADVVFLQEVSGRNDRHAHRHGNWPGGPQHEFLAEVHRLEQELGQEQEQERDGARSQTYFHVYGRNAQYGHGDHGNAILSRFPVLRWENQDVSAHRFESRGLLHAEIAVPYWPGALHCVCVHLGLTARGRGRQLEHLRQRIERMVPADAPLIVAGDFNDWHWRHRATHEFAHPLNMHEAFESHGGRPALSFPALLPFLRLDRIYVRGVRVAGAQVERARGWRHSSDHRALVCDVTAL
jgi:endonuclease/exonuclease/phosphatase family metal-dependent hydrolase